MENDVRQALQSFERIRSTFTTDLEPLFDSGDGGRYAIPLILAIGHEEIERMITGRKHRGVDSFRRSLPAALRAVADSLYSAIRHGLAHGYGTQLIDAGGVRVAVWFSFGPSPSPHVIDTRHLEGIDADVRIVLSTRTLTRAISRQFDELEEEIRLRPERWNELWANSGNGRLTRVGAKEAAAWRDLAEGAEKHRYFHS